MVYEYSNEKLATYYRDLKSIDKNPFSMHIIPKICTSIEECPVSISEVYKEEGCLKSISGVGIGKSTKSDLEFILRNGFDETLRITNSVRTKNLRNLYE